MTETSTRSASWKWAICGVLLLATMLNYMDRQTLSQTATDISRDLGLNNARYGRLETGFAIAFALGGLITGWLVDVIPVRWMYPLVVLGWSCAGFATAYSHQVGAWLQAGHQALFHQRLQYDGLTAEASTTYLGLFVCRIILGLFEAGQWPCALITTQRLLTANERTFGNSLLQSGASIGAIITPFIVFHLRSNEPGSWRLPFAVIGMIGIFWIIPWFTMIRASDLAPPTATNPEKHAPVHRPLSTALFLQRFVVLVFLVICINFCWHYYRAWMPKYLREILRYDVKFVDYFTSGYYVATDVGCLTAGFATHWLTRHHWRVFSARLVTFGICSLLCTLSILIPYLPTGWPLLSALLLVGAGSLGLFPNYYSFTQDLSVRNQGKITGLLSAITWVVTAGFQEWTGYIIDRTGSHAPVMIFVGTMPILACVAIWLFWGNDPPSPEVHKDTAP